MSVKFQTELGKTIQVIFERCKEPTGDFHGTLVLKKSVYSSHARKYPLVNLCTIFKLTFPQA